MASASSSSGSESDSDSSSSSHASATRKRLQPTSISQFARSAVTSSEETESSSEDETPKPQPANTSPSTFGGWAGYEEESEDDDCNDASPVTGGHSKLAANQSSSTLQQSRSLQSDPQPVQLTSNEDMKLRESRAIERWSSLCVAHLEQDYQAQKITLQLEHTLEKQKEEEDARRHKLQEEEKYKQRLLAEEARKREERRLAEIKRKAELQQLQAREAAFWSMLPPEEEQRLRGMLQATILYQQQITQNETAHTDLLEQINLKEKTYQSLRDRVQRSSQDLDVAREMEERARGDLGRWTRKRDQYENPGQDIEALRRRHHSLRNELQRLQEECEPLQVEAGALREKLTSSDEKSGMLASELVSVKAKSQQAVTTLQSGNVEALASLHAQQMEEFARLEVDTQNKLSDIRVKHAQEASILRQRLEEATRREEKHRKEREFTADELLEGQREGSRLNGLLMNVRQEVMELSARLKACGAYPSQVALSGSRTRSLSLTQLGKHVPPSPATPHNLDSSTCSMAGSRRGNSEIQLLRKQCRQLEKECSRTHAELEKQQEACDMWRKRSFDQGGSWSSVISEDPAPFTLGPADKDTSLTLLSPNGTRTL